MGKLTDMVSIIKSLIASGCARLGSNHPAYQVITGLLVPRYTLCDTVHSSPTRLCDSCIASLKSHYRQTPSSSDAIVTKDSLARSSANGVPRTPHRSSSAPFITEVRRLESAFNYQVKVPDLITHWKYKGMLELTPICRPLDLRAVARTDTKSRCRGPDFNTLAPAPYERVRPHMATDKCTGPRRRDSNTRPPSSTSKRTARSAAQKSPGSAQHTFRCFVA
jgi:hypothetical protein